MLPNSDDKFFTNNYATENEKSLEPISLSNVLNMAEEPIPWLIDGLLIQGGCSLLAAKPKVGKTTFSRSMALAVSRGEDFLNCKTQKSKVLLLTLEDKLSEVGRHFKSMGATEADEISILSVAPKSAAKLKKIVEENNFALIVVDTLILGVSGLYDLNDYLQVTQAISPYVAVARETNAHILFAHHLSKRERGGAGDQILGSTALFGSVDNVIVLDRQKQHRVFSTIQRYGLDLPTTRLNLTDTGHLKIGDEVNDETTIQDQILESLNRANQSMTEKEIESLVYGRTSEKRKHLRQLVQQGVILRSGSGSKNSPYQYSPRI